MIALVETENPDIIGITEIKPKSNRFSVQESEIAFEGYEIFHNLDKQGRGVALLIKPELKPTVNDRIISEFSEHIFVDCTQKTGEIVTIGLIYRSPNSSTENSQRLNDLIRSTASCRENLLIFGDFNYPDIDWVIEASKKGEGHATTEFMKAIKDSYLIQHQQEITRFIAGEKPSIVDLIFTNREEMITDTSTQAGLGKSDHLCLYFTLNMEKSESVKQERYCFCKTDEKILKDILQSIEWEKEIENLSSNDMWEKIKKHIFKAISASTPKTKSFGRKRKPWMDRGTLATVRRKYNLFRRWLATRKDYVEYLKARNKARKACRMAQKELERKIAAEAKTNPNRVWNYTKSKTTIRSGIPDLKKEDGSKAKTDSEKAELLNDFFKSVFTQEDKGPLPEMPKYSYAETLDNIDITPQEVEKILRGLHHGKAAGPDGISPRVLSLAAKELSIPITHLFRKTLETGELPLEWKTAYVSPIFKKGSKMLPNNYRPVSLTSVVCKVMEKIVRDKVMKHLQENDIITEEQHGFVEKRSCITQLLEVMDIWTEIVDEGGSLDIVYTDFMKAFDSVPHRRLIGKVEACGIKGKVLAWIKDFLEERTQRVVINNEMSSEGSVSSGIPQGSVLGPLLFVIYINDLPRHVESFVRIFADDTKVFSRVDLGGNSEKLQKDLDELMAWSDRWKLRFHPEKCCILKVGTKRETEYFMKSKNETGEVIQVRLKETTHEKDLGVTIDRDLNFKQHVQTSITKANRVVGLIRRSFEHLTPSTFIMLYKALVRPLVEYGHCVWEPSTKSLKSDIEDVQRRATKLIGNLKELPYPERLKRLKLPCLEHRRKRGDMIEVYKYLNGFYDVDRPHFQLSENSRTRGNKLKIAKPRHRLGIRGNYFLNRSVNMWNSLPDEVVSAPSVDSFKSRLDKHWAVLPSLYDPECQNNL